MAAPLRGRLMVGRLTLDQVVKVRVLAPQPEKHAGNGKVPLPASNASGARLQTDCKRALTRLADKRGNERSRALLERRDRIRARPLPASPSAQA